MTKDSHHHYQQALTLRDQIVLGQRNEPAVLSWAAVARQCAIANDKFRAESAGRVHGRRHQAFLENLDRVWWAARAQVETIARAA